MIDTVKVVVPISIDIYNKIKSVCDVKTSYNNSTGEIFYNITTNNLDGSYDSRLSVRVDYGTVYGLEYDYILILEGSFNKWLNGHNIYGSNNLHMLCSRVRKKVNFIFGVKLLDFREWLLYKVDYTVSFRLGYDDGIVTNYISSLRTLSYTGRTKIIPYGTETIMIPSSLCTKKIYNKLHEFKKNDIKRLIKSKNKLDIKRLLKFVEGLIRFECSIKTRKLKDYFYRKTGNKYVLIKDVRIDDLKKIWGEEFMKYYNVLDFAKYKIVSKERDVRDRLYQYYKPRLANLLYSFWLDCSKFGTLEAREVMPKTTFNRKMKQLKEVGIQIGQELIIDELDYSYQIENFSPFTYKAI